MRAFSSSPARVSTSQKQNPQSLTILLVIAGDWQKLYSMKSWRIPILLLVLGTVVAWFLLPAEKTAVDELCIGYPNSDRIAHCLRVPLLGLLVFIPFLCSLGYYLFDRLDRYTLRTFFTSFFICFGALYALMLLEELQNHMSDFQQSPEGSKLLATQIIQQFPSVCVFILPYSLMLSLLWSLGSMSKNQEIVATIQTGRSLRRFLRPLICFGAVTSLICLIFNYYWAPQAAFLEEQLLNRSTAEAHAVVYPDPARHWYVGTVPHDHSKGAPLENVTIYQLNDQEQITSAISTQSATWSKDSRKWTLKTPLIRHFSSPKTLPAQLDAHPAVTQMTQDMVTSWPETPFLIVKPGQKPHQLGVPGLRSWLANHIDNPLSFKRAYRTHLHFRFAQPFLCLIIVLLAAPLGISFHRRGSSGGIAVAILLCAMMVFCSTVFPTLGESGHLPPILAAWATNILFLILALYLLRMRITGKPIYQTFIGWLRNN